MFVEATAIPDVPIPYINSVLRVGEKESATLSGNKYWLIFRYDLWTQTVNYSLFHGDLTSTNCHDFHYEDDLHHMSLYAPYSDPQMQPWDWCMKEKTCQLSYRKSLDVTENDIPLLLSKLVLMKRTPSSHETMSCSVSSRLRSHGDTIPSGVVLCHVYTHLYHK